MAKTNQSLDFTSFITKKPSEKKQTPTPKNKTEAEKKIIKKTATPVVRPTQSPKKATPPINVPPKQDNIVETKEYVEKDFADYFEKKFTTENSDLVAIDRGLKNKIALLCSTNRKTSQISLVSNIIQEWFDKNEKEVNKQLKSIFK